jgi:hypothetical protein
MWYFEYEKERMQRKRIAEATKGVGRPKVGGPFELIDQYGNKFTSEDMKGRYALVWGAPVSRVGLLATPLLTRRLVGLLWIQPLP